MPHESGDEGVYHTSVSGQCGSTTWDRFLIILTLALHTAVLCSNSEAIGKFRLELQLFLHLKKLSLVDFLEVVSQIAARTEGRVAHDANVISHPTEIQNQNNFLFKGQPVLLKMTQVDFPPGFGKCLATLLAFIRHLFFWSV